MNTTEPSDSCSPFMGVSMPVPVRTRFEVFKRDGFTCRYCGRKSPEVILEIDHIVPVCEGGSDDPMNLATSCWDCNRGKAGISLSEAMTGEDPHDRAVLLLEKERQLREYNHVLETINKRVEGDVEALLDYWKAIAGGRTLYGSELAGLQNALKKHPSETIRVAMDAADRARKTSSLAYVHACLKRQAT